MPNALPLSRLQSCALSRATARELTWGLRAVSVELRKWREQAAAIPDAPLREDALHALDSKRGHTDGAALFWTLPTHRDLGLLRLLVAFEVIYDYLDNVSERGASEGARNGEQLFRALADAVDPDRPVADYYRFHPWSNDGGYLSTLVTACRAGCRMLPSFHVVRPFIALEAAQTPVLAINHQLDAQRRDAALQAWAARELPGESDLAWYELTAAASQSVVTFALLAVAADPCATRHHASATYHAYFPWFAYAVTMLDSYADQAEDLQRGAHSYIAHYPNLDLAVDRIRESVRQSANRLLALSCGERHGVVLGCMIAMYLSKNSARSPRMSDGSARIKEAGGTLTKVLLPILRMWRICNGQVAKT